VAAGTDVPAAEFERAARETDYGYAFLEDPAIETTEGYLSRRYDSIRVSPLRRWSTGYWGNTCWRRRAWTSRAGSVMGLPGARAGTVASLIEKESANAEERR
jgi:hypothetical protein